MPKIFVIHLSVFAVMVYPSSVDDEYMKTIYSDLLESEGYIYVGGGSYVKETKHGPILIEFEEGEGDFLC